MHREEHRAQSRRRARRQGQRSFAAAAAPARQCLAPERLGGEGQGLVGPPAVQVLRELPAPPVSCQGVRIETALENRMKTRRNGIARRKKGFANPGCRIGQAGACELERGGFQRRERQRRSPLGDRSRPAQAAARSMPRSRPCPENRCRRDVDRDQPSAVDCFAPGRLGWPRLSVLQRTSN